MLQLLVENIETSAQTVIDIGCNEGTFARALAERGYFVTGIEGQRQYADAAMAFCQTNRTPRIKIHNKILSPEDIMQLDRADVILLLSVHHQWVASYGLTIANQMLGQLAEKSNKQFFFSPACIKSKYGEGFSEFEDNDYQAIENYFAENIGKPYGCSLHFIGNVVNELPPQEPIRPLFLLQRAGSENILRATSMGRQPWQMRSDVFEVGLDISRIGFTQCPHTTGWCYLSACVQEASGNTEIDYNKSIIADYYRHWQPKNLGELLFSDAPFMVPFLASIPTRTYKPPLPWSDDVSLKATDNGKFIPNLESVPDSEFHLHGPLKSELVAREVDRLLDLRKKLSLEGYNPELNHDGYIRGFFLLYKGQKRFMITGGQHRAGVLGGMQIDTVHAKFEPTCQRVYDFADVERWPAVKRGLYSVQEAEAVIDRIFLENGHHILRMVNRV
jgi:hypothetical protein